MTVYLPKRHSRAHPWGPLAEEYFLARSRKAAAWPLVFCTERLGPRRPSKSRGTRPSDLIASPLAFNHDAATNGNLSLNR
jgi:hypothetical protein